MPAIHTIVFAIANYVIEVKIQLLLQATVFTGPLLQVISFGISLVLNPNCSGSLKEICN